CWDGPASKRLAAIPPSVRPPAWAIAAFAAWSILLIVAVALTSGDKSMFDRLTDFAMFGAVIFETLAVSTIFVFRRRLPEAPRPYRCLGYPVVPLLYLVLPAYILISALAYEQTRTEAVIGTGFIALGAAVYFGLGLQRRGVRSEN